MQNKQDLKAQLRSTWIRKLYLWWHHYNGEYLAGALRPPVIQLGCSVRQLGCWDEEKRVLTISQTHIEQVAWHLVLDTLRHEMAHQYVQEVLKVEGEGPHGNAFQHATKRLRCVNRTQEDVNGGQYRTREARLVRVLKKILCLADSPNENEAQAAVQKARYLMGKYSIDVVEMDNRRSFSSRCLGEVKGRRLPYELWLASILSSFFFVEVLWTESYDARRDQQGTILEIYGRLPNLDMSEYVYHYLVGVLDRLWEQYKTANRLGSNRERQRYFAGVMEGFYRKLEEQEQTLQQSQALVWKGDPGLRAFFKFINPSVKTRYWGGSSRTGVYRDGLEDGKRVGIRQPVTSGGETSGRYLRA